MRPMPNSYDIEKTYAENYEAGPQLSGIDLTVPTTPMKRLLNFDVRSRLGIAAGLLLNSKWIEAYAQLGFDVLTYKTVRSSFRPCYPLPNWVFVTDDGQLEGPIYARAEIPCDPSQVTSAVCFGMPSMAPDVWRADVGKAKEVLMPGQLLVVSVVATPQEGWGAEEIAADFALCARWAAEAGADLVEANLSCPNVCTAEGSIYRDSIFSQLVSKTVRESLGELPLLLKIGYFEQGNQLSDFLGAVAPFADGVTMVNGITRPVLHPDGRPVFGESYLRAGVLGRSIHAASVRAVSEAKQMVADQALDLSILAVGGASLPKDIDDFFKVGADAVMMGSSPMYLPDLAVEAKSFCTEW